MMPTIIFAIEEDGTLNVFPDIQSVRQSCEGIDVESSVWNFYDSNGMPLRAVFHSPNETKKHLFGLINTVVSSQNFDLVPISDGSEPLLFDFLDHTLLNKNSYFNDIESVKMHLRKAIG